MMLEWTKIGKLTNKRLIKLSRVAMSLILFLTYQMYVTSEKSIYMWVIGVSTSNIGDYIFGAPMTVGFISVARGPFCEYELTLISGCTVGVWE